MKNLNKIEDNILLKNQVVRKNVGERIKILRKLKNWTKQQLAEQIDTTPDVIRKYESGSALPKPEGLVILSSLFSVTVDWLLTGKGEIDISTRDAKEVDPVHRMLAKTQAIIESNIASWGARWKWLELFDSFLSNEDLMNELQPTWDELQYIRNVLTNKKILTIEELINHFREKFR